MGSFGKLFCRILKPFGSLLILVLVCLVGSSCDGKEGEPSGPENGSPRFLLVNYLGNTQNIHPKVLYFKEGWHGFRFWMAYTPYPYGSTTEENPCIAVSNDGIVWNAPHGLVNPLAAAPEGGYNSDTHLVYDEENDVLECWWREYRREDGLDAIIRRVSKDGVVWSDPQVVMPYEESWGCRLSPAVWIEAGCYRLVYSDCKKLFITSVPVGVEKFEWSRPEELPVEWGELKAWHQDVVSDGKGMLRLVVCAFLPGGNNNTADLYYVEVKSDLSEASIPEMILDKQNNVMGTNYRSIYRSSFVRVEDEVYLYYSAIDNNWRRSMSLLRGESLFSLHPLDAPLKAEE